ncbi:hypothetical protein Tco_1506162 [Tanacetum coccineum]
MRTRSSSHLIAESSTTPKHRNRRRSKQRVELFSLEEESRRYRWSVRFNVLRRELLQAPTEGHGDCWEIKLSALSTAKPKTDEGLKTAGYRVTTAGSRLLLLGRKITKINQDHGISLVQHDAEIQGRHEHEPEFDFDAANIPVTTTSVEISTASPEVKTTGDSIEDIAAETLVYIRRSATKAKDKAVRLQAELDKEERHRCSIAEGLIQELLQKIFIQAERSRR